MQFGVLSWVIWTDRNKELHGEGKKKASRAAKFALDYIREYNLAQGSSSCAQQREKVVWVPPPESYYKVNFDGSLHEQNRIGGIGVIVRNSSGEVMGALARPPQWFHDPMQIEALSAVTAVQFNLLRTWGLVKLSWKGTL
ncbi:hypothetical protein PTKIN_Ptkin14bG0197700 [Pterospermum kingtungense]